FSEPRDHDARGLYVALVRDDFSLTHQYGSQIRERCQVSAGSHGALARNAGEKTLVHQLTDPVEQLGAHPGGSADERAQASHENRSSLFRSEVSARPATVKAHEIEG